MNSAQPQISAASFSPNSLYEPGNLGTSSSGSSNLFSSFDWRMWLLIILLLAFLGINIFAYLAKGTQTITDIVSPITQYFGSLFGNTAINATKQTVNVSATGAKAGVDIAAGTVTTGLDVAQQTISGQSSPTNSQTVNTSQVNQTNQTSQSLANNTLNKALNDATSSLSIDQSQSQNQGQSQDSPTYQADDSYSSIQSSKTSGKAGWCYIGEERGIRSCIEVGVNDQCMSGDIFPSQEICVNPTLRM